MPLYSFETAGQLEPHLQREWLLTNRLGSFASSSVVGCNRRRYHGLFVAATLPPVGRIMALNRVGEILILDGRADRLIELSINDFKGNLHPRGDRYLQRFELDDADDQNLGAARWIFEADGVHVVKELGLLANSNVATLRYTATADDPNRSIELRLLPFVSLRDFHALRRAPGSQFEVAQNDGSVTVADGVNALHLRIDGAKFVRKPDWWFGHTYAIETERGQGDTEDLFLPGHFTLIGKGAVECEMICTLKSPADESSAGATGAAKQAAATSPKADDTPATQNHSLVMQRLRHAADQFLVRRRRPDDTLGWTILAGYPWFSDWGRDTMISLPGLLLDTRRFDLAENVLAVFAQFVSQGMVPNVFDDYTNAPAYNTVDASLWFIHACFEFKRLAGETALFNSALLPACREIIKGYRDGTRYHIRMDPADGLITQGDARTQLTWMDAKCNGVAFTPRQGKPVEINALWYNALRLMGENDLADRVRDSFRQTFWHNPFRGLFDVVDGPRIDGSCRPNQIFAVALPHSPLTDEQRRAVVEVVRRELLTPVGLRTLSRSDPSYAPRYTGPQFERDRAYHNGTVWPWLVAYFYEAYLNIHNDSPESHKQVRDWMVPLLTHMDAQACIGSISEIFEAEPPHRPVGCCAQAWSVAGLLRIASRLKM